MLRCLKTWHQNPAGIHLLNHHGFGALDGGCYLYAQWALKRISPQGKIAGIYNKNHRLEHFVLQLNDSLCFDGNGVLPLPQLLKILENLEGIEIPYLRSFATPHEAKKVALARGIPHQTPIPKNP